MIKEEEPPPNKQNTHYAQKYVLRINGEESYRLGLKKEKRGRLELVLISGQGELRSVGFRFGEAIYQLNNCNGEFWHFNVNSNVRLIYPRKKKYEFERVK